MLRGADCSVTASAAGHTVDLVVGSAHADFPNRLDRSALTCPAAWTDGKPSRSFEDQWTGEEFRLPPDPDSFPAVGSGKYPLQSKGGWLLGDCLGDRGSPIAENIDADRTKTSYHISKSGTVLSGLIELVVQPVLEVALQLAGYLTGCVVVPTFTLGRVLVEPDPKEQVVLPSGGGIERRADGTYIMDAELGSLCGLVFWAIVGIGIYIYRCHA